MTRWRKPIFRHFIDGDPEEPTLSRIPGGPTYLREGAPAGKGTPPEFWVRLLIGQAEEGNRGAKRALELAHHIYRTAQLAAWQEAATAHLETIRQSARLLASWMAARSENRSGHPSTSWRHRQLRLHARSDLLELRRGVMKQWADYLEGGTGRVVPMVRAHG